MFTIFETVAGCRHVIGRLGGFFFFQGRSPIGLGLVELLGRDGILLPQLPDALIRLFKQFGLRLGFGQTILGLSDFLLPVALIGFFLGGQRGTSTGFRLAQFGGGFGAVEQHQRLPLGDGGAVLDQDGFDPAGDFGRNVDLGGFDFPLDVVDRGIEQEKSSPRAESQDDQSSDHGDKGVPLNPHTLLRTLTTRADRRRLR